MSVANLSKEYTFKNSGEKEYNDVIFPDLFELADRSFSFNIRPKTKFWRFGFRFSKIKEIEFYHPSHRYKDPDFKKFKDLHLGVGEWNGKIWDIPDRIHLAHYNFDLADHILNYSEYSDSEKIECSIKYIVNENALHFSYKTEKGKEFSRSYLLDQEYKYFKVFAWADKTDFEIDCTIQVTTVGKDLNDINLQSNHFWFLKLSPESWRVENFRVGKIEEFSTHKYNLTEPNTIISKRPEYDLYFKVNEGDKVIGYAYQNHDAAVCLFDVVSPVHMNRAGREIINIKVSEVLEPKIPIELFRNKITFESDLNTTSQIRLIEITKDIYDAILNTNDDVYEDKVNLLNDNMSKEDLLFRTPFVNALADYIDRLWKSQPQEAYTIHLSGEWGSGKSNILNFLEKRLENKNHSKIGKKEKSNFKEDWLVIRYNAWENQHINPPWWVFMDNVYRNIQKKETWIVKLINWFREQWWRAVAVNLFYWISFLLFAVVTFFLIRTFRLEDIWAKPENNINKENVLKPIIALFSVLGTFWLIFKGISNSLIPGSSEAALNFQKNIRDPMDTVKKHFAKVVGYTNKNVAIFIDDIDRCNSESTVRLLEGIQILFKSSKVLYIISGDAAWIRKCFELHYEKFKSVVDSPGHGLGDFFLEKIFQMNTSVPIMTKSVIKSFWNNLIKGPDNIRAELPIEENKLNQARQELINKKTETEINQVIESKKGESDELYFRQAAVEQISNKEVIQNLKHRLEQYSIFLPPNPRSLKRLINNYALSRQALILQGASLTDVTTDSLVRWLILNSKFPEYADKIIKNPEKIMDSEYNSATGYSDLVAGHLNSDIINSIIGK